MSNFPSNIELGLAGLALTVLAGVVATMAGLLKKQQASADETKDYCDNQCMTQLGPYIAKNIEVNTRLVTLLEQSQTTMAQMTDLLHAQNTVMQEMVVMLRGMAQDLRDIR